MLLAEELLLLGLDPAEGPVVSNARPELLAGLAGALADALALAGLVDLSGKRFAVGSPPGDPCWRAAHQALAQSTGRRAAAQPRGPGKGIGGAWSRLVDGLADRGVLGRRRDHVFLFTVTRHPVLQLSGFTGCVNQRYAVNGVLRDVGFGSVRRGTGTLAATLTHYRTKIFGHCVTYAATVSGSLSLAPS